MAKIFVPTFKTIADAGFYREIGAYRSKEAAIAGARAAAADVGALGHAVLIKPHKNPKKVETRSFPAATLKVVYHEHKAQ